MIMTESKIYDLEHLTESEVNIILYCLEEIKKSPNHTIMGDMLLELNRVIKTIKDFMEDSNV